MSAITDRIPQLPAQMPATASSTPTTPTSTVTAAAAGTTTPPALTPPTSTIPAFNPEPTARGLFDLQAAAQAPEAELLRHRFLCRQGSMLIVGNTGIGKSSLVMQMMIQWALGAGCFGIEPARPLRSLLVQGENDEQDMAEMRDGVAGSLQLTDEQRATVNRSVVVCHEVDRVCDEFADEVLDRLINQHNPDLVWIDPVFQYLDGDSNQQDVVSRFLRKTLGSLLKRHQCALIIVHHTNKPAKTKPIGNVNLRAYDAAGSAEFANWPRAMLSLQATNSSMTYKLVAAKRGGKLGWVMADGTTRCYEKPLSHSRLPGVIHWEEVAVAPANPAANNADGQQQQQPANADADDGLDDADRAILAALPVNGSEEKKVLVERVRVLNEIGKNTLDASMKKLILDKRLEEFQVRRPKTRAEVHVRRTQQQQPPLAPQQADNHQHHQQQQPPVAPPQPPEPQHHHHHQLPAG